MFPIESTRAFFFLIPKDSYFSTFSETLVEGKEGRKKVGGRKRRGGGRGKEEGKRKKEFLSD